MNLQILGLGLAILLSTNGITNTAVEARDKDKVDAILNNSLKIENTVDSLINKETLSNGIKAPTLENGQKNWATDIADELYKNGQLQDSNYNKETLEEEISRIEFAKIAVDSLGLADLTQEDREKYVLSDIEKTSPDYEIAVKAIKAGIINGVGTDSEGRIIVSPDSTITREQMAKIADKSFVGDLKTQEVVDADKVLSTKTDGNKVADWAKKPMAQLVTEGIIKGDDKGNINPQANIKRGEAYAMFDRLSKGRNAMIMVDTQEFISYKSEILKAKEEIIAAKKAGKMNVVADKEAFILNKQANYGEKILEKQLFIEAKKEFIKLKKEYDKSPEAVEAKLQSKKEEISKKIENKKVEINTKLEENLKKYETKLENKLSEKKQKFDNKLQELENKLSNSSDEKDKLKLQSEIEKLKKEYENEKAEIEKDIKEDIQEKKDDAKKDLEKLDKEYNKEMNKYNNKYNNYSKNNESKSEGYKNSKNR